MVPVGVYPIEGVDGVGKTTHCQLLAERTGGIFMPTPPKELTSARKYFDRQVDELEARYLFYLAGVLALRPQMDRAIAEGRPVFCDRYIYSTIAYHAEMGVNTDLVDWKHLAFPSVSKVILLTAEPEIRLARIRDREGERAIVAYRQRLPFLANVERRLKEMSQISLDTSRSNIEEVHEGIVNCIIGNS